MQKYLALSGFFMKYSAPLGLPFCASCAMCLGLFQEFACMPRDHPGLPHSSRACQQCAQKCICTFYPGRCLETLFFKHTLPVGLSATPHASVFECCLCVVLFFKKNVYSITSQTSKHSLASCSTSGLVVPFLATTTTPGEPQQSPRCGHLYCPKNSYQLAMVQQSGNACSEANGLNSAVTGGEC